MKPFTNTLPGNYPTDREVFVVVATDGVHKHLTQWDIRRDHDGTITALEEFFLDPAEPPGRRTCIPCFTSPLNRRLCRMLPGRNGVPFSGS